MSICPPRASVLNSSRVYHLKSQMCLPPHQVLHKACLSLLNGLLPLKTSLHRLALPAATLSVFKTGYKVTRVPWVKPVTSDPGVFYRLPYCTAHSPLYRHWSHTGVGAPTSGPRVLTCGFSQGGTQQSRWHRVSSQPKLFGQVASPFSGQFSQPTEQESLVSIPNL